MCLSTSHPDTLWGQFFFFLVAPMMLCFTSPWHVFMFVNNALYRNKHSIFQSIFLAGQFGVFLLSLSSVSSLSVSASVLLCLSLSLLFFPFLSLTVSLTHIDTHKDNQHTHVMHSNTGTDGAGITQLIMCWVCCSAWCSVTGLVVGIFPL